MDQLRITPLQFNAIWENTLANLRQLEKMLAALPPGSTDLIILPETFSTGFTNAAARVAEPMSGPVVQWMLSQAKKQDAVLAGSVIISAEDTFYNRFLFAFPDGSLETYDKRHLFTLAKEHENYSAGKERKIIEIKGWKVFPQICYDLRFPVWSRNDLGYDLAIYVANWPSPRKEAWRALLVARAIENQAFVIGVNRVGADANGLEYHGNSVCIDYTGIRLLEMAREAGAQTITIDKAPMAIFRSKLAFLKDQDKFSLHL